MIKLLPKRRTPSTILGLTLDGSRLEGVVLRRSNGTLHVQKTFFATLALNPLNADPELMGREIRNHLEQAGVRERRCVVGIPLNLALTLQLKLPDLPEEDIASFLAIEAERGFPYGPEALALATSRYRTANGEQHATLLAIPKSHLQQLESALRAAQLRPIGFRLGITALQGAEKDSSNGVLALAVGDNTVDLQLTCGGGVALLRALEGAIESEGVQKRLYGDVVAREIRVSLGQLPGEIRSAIRKVRLFGDGELAQRFAQDVAPRLQAMGVQLELVKSYAADEFRSKPPPETPVSAALSIAARHLTGVASGFEFLPPKVSPFQQLTARFSSRKIAWIGSAAAAVVVLVGGAILLQHWQLARLRSQWAGMEKPVRELEDMQQQIRRFRPWFDESFQGLSILRRLTEAFPAEGVVSAKTVEIRELSTVTCSGVALDNQAFLKMLDQLRASKEVGEVKVDQVRGKTPLQFTLNFQWGKGGASAN
jgi:hypothetical protein